MTEQEAWTLMAAYSNNNALYFLANIIAVWLGFLMSSKIYESDNAPTTARLLATTYCL